MTQDQLNEIEDGEIAAFKELQSARKTCETLKARWIERVDELAKARAVYASEKINRAMDRIIAQ